MQQVGSPFLGILSLCPALAETGKSLTLLLTVTLDLSSIIVLVIQSHFSFSWVVTLLNVTLLLHLLSHSARHANSKSYSEKGCVGMNSEFYPNTQLTV